MGVLNVTPDSFSDGGLFNGPDIAVQHALDMVQAGADLIDVGGESTRPGAAEVAVDEEMRRVIPVIRAIAAAGSTTVSIDTSKPEVMRAAADAGAGMINDVFALQRPGALEAAVETGLPVCLMHMQGEPRTMQDNPRYDDVTAEVETFLLQRAVACEALGMHRERIVLDPGFGFGKNLEHNLQLLRDLPRLAAHGYPLLVGLSRKSMLGAITGGEADERLAGSLALAMLAVQGGASLVRVHDVAQTRNVLDVMAAVWPPGSVAE